MSENEPSGNLSRYMAGKVNLIYIDPSELVAVVTASARSLPALLGRAPLRS
jgi:hypothetical protein